MTSLHLPWIELAIFLPLAGAVWVRFIRNPDVAREHSLFISGAAFVCSLVAWFSLNTGGTAELAREQWHVHPFGPDIFVIDELSAPLLPPPP